MWVGVHDVRCRYTSAVTRMWVGGVGRGLGVHALKGRHNMPEPRCGSGSTGITADALVQGKTREAKAPVHASFLCVLISMWLDANRAVQVCMSLAPALALRSACCGAAMQAPRRAVTYLVVPSRHDVGPGAIACGRCKGRDGPGRAPYRNEPSTRFRTGTWRGNGVTLRICVMQLLHPRLARTQAHLRPGSRPRRRCRCAGRSRS